MPYIITTRQAAEPPNHEHGVRAAILSRRAVATLDEAADMLRGLVDPGTALDSIDAILRAMSPLSAASTFVNANGTVIEVEHVRWDVVLEAALARGHNIVRTPGDGGRPVLDAFNAE